LIAESRLRWRCRRGMLELDLLLNAFLDQKLKELTAAECSALEQLLEYPDQLLMEYLFGRTIPADEEIIPIVAKIRTTVS